MMVEEYISLPEQCLFTCLGSLLLCCIKDSVKCLLGLVFRSFYLFKKINVPYFQSFDIE